MIKIIRQLLKSDNEIVMDLLSNEKELNLFIIGDIENNGYETDFQKLWGEFRDGRLIAVLLKYYDNFVFYSRDSFFVQGFASIMMAENGRIVSGEASIVSAFRDLMGMRPTAVKQFCKLNAMKFSMQYTDTAHIKILTGYEDETKIDNTLTLVMQLYDLIREFDPHPSADVIKRRLLEHNCRIYYVISDDIITAMAQTSAENADSAMVVAVCTHPDYRNRGYATACVAKLCGDLVKERKTVCLIYDNENAGRIYKSLGFEIIGEWAVYELQKPISAL